MLGMCNSFLMLQLENNSFQIEYGMYVKVGLIKGKATWTGLDYLMYH